MSPRKIDIAPALIKEGKRLYEETLTPLRDIAALMGISRRTLENRIRAWNWRRRRIASRPIDLFHAVRGAAVAAATDPARPAEVDSRPVSPQQRNELTNRIQNVIERELNAVDQVLAVLSPADGGEAERVSRTLASLARTLREVAALNHPDAVTPPDETDDDPLPSNIDEFRNELARRINALIDERERDRDCGAGGSGAAPAGDGA